MAKKRMFSLDIIDTDLFMDMPQTSRLLYYELCMRADDDGFVASPKKIMKMVGCNEDDFRILIGKQFVIPFDTGIVVIKHWKIHNYIQKDRYKETIYTEEKSELIQEKNGVYTKCIQNGYTDKISIDQIRLDKNSKDKYGEFKNVLLTEEEYHKLEISNLLTYIEKLSSYIASTGKRYKSHYATILNWSRKDGKNTNKELADKLTQDIKEEQASEEEIKALEDRIKNR